MITIVSGTNRPGSNTSKIAKAYFQILNDLQVDCKFLSLETNTVHTRNADFEHVEKEFLIPAQKFIFVFPEYNGSFPGILKLMIDNSDVSKCFHNKKALLTGVATGRAGNLRGMEHLTGSLMHMKMTVHPNRLPISMVDKLNYVDGVLSDENTIEAIKSQIQAFLTF
jgi:NAD(P)H-dependent FMN reductase